MMPVSGTPSTSKSAPRRAARALLTVGLIAGPLIFADAMATVLVVKSSGPSAGTYKPGRALPDNAKVALQPADVLVVLAAESKRTFHGPGTFNLADASAGSQAPTAVRRGRFSALRSAGIVPRSPTLWHVDVSQSGKFCLTDKSNVMLWRPEATDAVTLTLSGAGGASQKIDWPAGQPTLAWPSGLPVTTGTDYQVSWNGKGAPTHVTFATLPVTPTDVRSVAQALIDEHCENQLNLLIDTVPTDSAG